MKIIDAQERYRSQIQSYRSEMSKVAKRRKEIQEQLKGATGEDKEALDKEAATIELTYKSLQDKQDEYYDYMNSLADHTWVYPILFRLQKSQAACRAQQQDRQR